MHNAVTLKNWRLVASAAAKDKLGDTNSVLPLISHASQ
jgi:hypothetical protein